MKDYFDRKAFIGNREIIVLYSNRKENLSIFDGKSLVTDGKYGHHIFQNERGWDFKGFQKLGYISDLTNDDKKLLRFISENKISTGGLDPIDYLEKLVEFDETKFKEVFIAIPNFTPKLTGKKRVIKVDLQQSQFKTLERRMDPCIYDIDVYVKDFDENANTDVEYSCYIPDELYNELYRMTDKDKIPYNKIIKEISIVRLKEKLIEHCNDLRSYMNEVEQMKKNKKMLAISYESNVNTHYDDYNHGLIGDNVGFNFRYYVLYKSYNEHALVNKNTYFTKEKKLYNTGLNANKVNDGYNVIQEASINNRNEILIDWTQEREDFLKNIQDSFINIKNNLDNFMSKLNDKEIDLLLESSPNLFLPKS